tara:strand:+ start:750 stop:1526 length:777 start_codon:yes stop_codon:yes gene_type:complete
MFYKKKGMPEQGELVICTIKKVLPHSVFCYIDEYDRKEGMIHISEVSPGRIRNIRDHVKEGKRVVCKILDIKHEKGHIDLSLRRVNQGERIHKNASYKQEQKAEKLLGSIGKPLKKDISTMYREAGYKILDEFHSLYNGFQEVVKDEKAFDTLNIDKDLKTKLVTTIREKIKIPEVTIEGDLILTSHESNGIEYIKSALEKAQAQKGKITIKYTSAPKYKITVTASDYKEAETILKNTQEAAIKEIKNHGSGEFVRAK